MKSTYKTIDQYISRFPDETREKLFQLHEIILESAPGSEQKISYGMPAYRLHGVLVYFAGYKHHIGFYPTSTAISAFENEISVYKYSKGAVQFPLDKPLPVRLIKRMVKFRVKENSVKEKLRNKKSK